MRPLILITNDDGIFSPGLLAVAEAVQPLGDILIAAPRFQQTTMGRAFPRGKDIGSIEEIILTVNGKPVTAFGITGSPAQAVAYALLELTQRKPDLCISGINYGENVGLSLTCSGTLGAAFEADSHGVPSIAVSREMPIALQHSREYAEASWEISGKIVRDIACKILGSGLPGEISIININVPENADDHTEVRWTRQSRLNSAVFVKPAQRDRTKGHQLQSEPYPWQQKAEKDSDIYAIFHDKVISVTPITWDLSVKTDWRFNHYKEVGLC